MLVGMSTNPTASSKTTFHRWPEGAIVYQVYPRSFYDANGDGIGDIPGVTAKLDYLKTFGVNAIWLSPFYPSPMADFGYDVQDYCDVDPIFGDLHDFKELLAAAHKKDIRIMVDLVPNHSSDEHPWFHQSRQSREDVYSDWYIWKDPKGHDKAGKPIPPNNWINVLTGETAWEWEPARQQFYMHSFHIKQPDLNWANPAVREAIKNAMRFWLDLGVDGFRVDAVPFMAKDPLFRDEPVNPKYRPNQGMWRYDALIHLYSSRQPHLYSYLAEMAAVLAEKKYANSTRFMVTEAYPDTDDHVADYLELYESMNPEVAAPFIFAGLSLPWKAADWRKFLHDFHTALDTFSSSGVASYAFGNHDQHRLATRLLEPAARAAAVLLLTLPGMSFIYNGEELGMEDGEIPPEMVQDPQFAGGFGRDPARTPMQWTSGKLAGFTAAHRPWLPIAANYKTHNVDTETDNPHSFLSLYRTLGKLRNDSGSIKHGSFKVLKTNQPDVLCYVRAGGKEQHVIFINFAKTSVEVEIPEGRQLGKFVVSSNPKTSLASNLGSSIRLLGYEAAVFTLNISI